MSSYIYSLMQVLTNNQSYVSTLYTTLLRKKIVSITNVILKINVILSQISQVCLFSK